MSNDQLKAELAALRAKRKPAMTDAERAAQEERAALLAERAAELRAIREEENADIIAKHAPNKTREFSISIRMASNLRPSSTMVRRMLFTLVLSFAVLTLTSSNASAMPSPPSRTRMATWT